MKRAVILVAAGKGSRFGGDVPKQFLSLNGMPVYLQSLAPFLAIEAEWQVIVVVPANYSQAQIHALQEEASQFFSCSIDYCRGGQHRFESVQNGLAQLKPSVQLVAIHDAVRPLVHTSTIVRAFQRAQERGNAIPVVDVVDSLRKRNGDGRNYSVPRSEYCLVQTPQCFQKEIILEAYKQEYSNHFTDDASVVEGLGIPIELVEGNRDNVKITTPSDFLFAEWMLREGKQS